ncbi:PWWP domain-containing DNA repair factor 3A isoform 2-T2 [Liasis olivaceus]
MMGEGEYVLCKWKKRLWPAQIMSRSQTSRRCLVPKEKLGSIRVKIIAENKQVTVYCARIEPVTVQSIENIADKLGPSKEANKVVEELTYRRALREVLEILKKREAPGGLEPFRRRSGEASTGEGQQEESSAPQQRLSPQRSPRGTKRMEKAGWVPPASPASLSGPLGSGTNSPSPRKPPSSASGDLSDRELAWEGRGVSKSPKPNISGRLAAPSQPNQRSPRASKRHRQVGGPSGEEAPLTRPARTSTPTSASHKRCPRFPPAKGRAGAAPGLRRNLLDSSVEGFSSQPADALPAKREAPPPRKCQKTSSGTRRSPRLGAACPKQSPAARGPSLKRPRRRSCREHREPSRDSAPWGRKAEPSPDRAGDGGGRCWLPDVAVDEGPSKEANKVVEELTYRRALREVLEILKKREAPGGLEPFRRRSGEASTGEGQQEESSAPQQRLSPQRSPRGTKRMEKAGWVPPASPAALSGPLGSGTNSPSPRKPPSSASGDLSDRELAWEGHGVLNAPKPNISGRLATPSQPNRRSPRASKRHRQVGGPSGEEAPLTRPARTSTPTSASHKRCPRFPAAKGRAGAPPGLRRNLLDSSVEGFSSQPADALPAKREAPPPRKCQKTSSGTRRSPRLGAACPKQSPAARGPSLKRPRRRSCREHREPSRDSAPWGRKAEPSPDRAGDGGGRCWLPDVAVDEDQASDLSLQLSPVRKVSLSPDSKDEEEEEELPSILLHQEPCSFEAGMMVWCKLPRYPYWPAVGSAAEMWQVHPACTLVLWNGFIDCKLCGPRSSSDILLVFWQVKKVNRKAKKASVLLIEKSMDAKKSKGFSTSLRGLKHFDCEEKQMLIDKARERYNHDINWCISLIADYRIRVGCHSFVGSFLEYCADDMSYPVRKEALHNLSQMDFPQMEELDSQEFLAEMTPSKRAKKILPDRTRAARDRANKRIVEFIVKARGADEHLRSILNSKKQSRWLKKSLKTPQYLILETYLEDDDQQDLVLKYLRKVYREVGAKKLPLKNRDSSKFVLEVLFPEAIIYAISAVDQVDYKTAEEKYINGPLVSQREREQFEKAIEEQKQKQHQQSENLSAEDEL